MISYDVNCFICKKTYQVDEKSPQYQRVKLNFNGKHCCTDCTEKIERDAALITGINRELLEELEMINIEVGLNPLSF
ncbi:MAG: hypothetical protein ACXVP5_07280 [Tumebacillaceae bacterium]